MQDVPVKPSPKKQKVGCSGKAVASAKKTETPRKKDTPRKATKAGQSPAKKDASQRQDAKVKGSSRATKTKKKQRIASDSDEQEDLESDFEVKEVRDKDFKNIQAAKLRSLRMWVVNLCMFLPQLGSCAPFEGQLHISPDQGCKLCLQEDEDDEGSEFGVDLDSEEEITPAKKKAKYSFPS